MGLHPVAVVGRLVQKQERDDTQGEAIHKTIQKHRIHKMENKNTKQENKSTKNIEKNKSRVIRK
jgi:hypothetical protein